MKQPASLDRASLAQTMTAWLAMLAALTLLGAVLAHWSWTWFAPGRQPRALPVVQRDAALAPAYRLFGSAPREAEPSGLAIELLGVAADSGGKPGYAVLRIGATRIVAAREGEQVEPGIRLAEVQADHVVLQRAGGRETLTFPRKPK